MGSDHAPVRALLRTPPRGPLRDDIGEPRKVLDQRGVDIIQDTPLRQRPSTSATQIRTDITSAKEPTSLSQVIFLTLKEYILGAVPA